MHKLLKEKPGEKVLLLGNEAIARGALEAGVAFASTYPGTPSSEISLNLFQISRSADLYFEYSTNEKVALEVAAAAANSGVRSLCIMKHVGMNVAADTLITLAYVGIKAGLVIISADDPFMFSSQNEQDNRYYGKLSGLPILEPSSVDEAKEMTAKAFDLSEALGEPVILRTTTRINHSTSVVQMGEMIRPRTQGDFEKDPFSYVTVPAVSRKLHARLLENMKKAEAMSEKSDFNFSEGKGALGIIVNGVSYNYVKDAVADLYIFEKVKILRIGFSNPMPGALIKAFLQGCEKVLIVEEGEPYMEESVKAFAQEAGLNVQIAGKGETLFSRLFEFDPSMVRSVIAGFFKIPYTLESKPELSDIPDIPQRPPNLCAGCMHRATFYALKQATKGMETIHPTDIGCYTLGFLPPLSIGDFLICMGSSVGTSGGFSKVTDKKVVSIIGDSTFFHSGIPGLVNGVFNNHNFTLIILDNSTTAMTGHQPHPGVDMDELGFEGYNRISIEALVKSLGVQLVSVIKPYHIKKSIEQIKEAVNFKGISVIISKDKCTLFTKNFKQVKKNPFQVTEKCKNHKECINELGCPAFYIQKGRVKINETLCTGCSVCAQICPEKAISPVKS